jgi:uncharacterized repeat protein (TIGR03803 family)
MRPKNLTLLTVLALAVFAFSSVRAAALEKIIYYFNNAGGGYPYASLILKGGNLYGSATGAGEYDNGTIFELSPNGDTWTETVLYAFTGGLDGSTPWSDLIFDSAGNIYGTTYWGGAYGVGVVFELSASESGWTETVLHSFRNGGGSASAQPNRLTFQGGKLYGTTSNGGLFGLGSAFELVHSDRGWTENVIWNFDGPPSGGTPVGGLVFDAQGNLYGAAFGGGSGGGGVIFELLPLGDGSWGAKVLYAFPCCGSEDGSGPVGLTLGKDGNFYGTAGYGGTGVCPGFPGCGTVWQLSHSSSGWTETTLYNFAGGSDGIGSNSDLLLNQAGNIYGTTNGGVTSDSVVFKLTPSTSGWSKTTLLDLGTEDVLKAGVIAGPDGSLIGANSEGGQNYGYVFEVSQ